MPDYHIKGKVAKVRVFGGSEGDELTPHAKFMLTRKQAKYVRAQTRARRLNVAIAMGVSLETLDQILSKLTM